MGDGCRFQPLIFQGVYLTFLCDLSVGKKWKIFGIQDHRKKLELKVEEFNKIPPGFCFHEAGEQKFEWIMISLSERHVLVFLFGVRNCHPLIAISFCEQVLSVFR